MTASYPTYFKLSRLVLYWLLAVLFRLTSLETKLTLEARVAQIVQERKVRVFRTSIL